MVGDSVKERNIPSKIFSIDGEPIMECVIKQLTGGGARIVVAYMPELIPNEIRLEIDNVRPKYRVLSRIGNELVVDLSR